MHNGCNMEKKLLNICLNVNKDKSVKADDETEEIVLKVPVYVESIFFYSTGIISTGPFNRYTFVLLNNEIYTSEIYQQC